MSKNKILIIILLIVLIGIGFAFYYFNGMEKVSNLIETGTITPSEDAFPSSSKINLPDNAPANTVSPQGTITEEDYAQNTNENVGVGEIKKVSDVAVGGMTFISKNGQSILRYIEKGTGHIKETTFGERIPTDVTNTTITAIFDSFWGAGGDSLVFRRLDGENNTVQTIYGSIGKVSAQTSESEAEIKQLNTTLLPQGTMNVAVSPDKNKIVYLVRSGENSQALISDFGINGPTNKKTKIWESPIKEWAISWPSLNKISLATKPAYNVGGYLYSLSTSGNNFEKILGDIPGLTSLSNKMGSIILYSETTGTGFMSYYFDAKDEISSVFPVTTLPEKCVFSRLSEKVLYCGVPNYITGSKYPDTWYQGLTSFTDTIYRVDLDVNYKGEIINQTKLGDNIIDVTNPILSDDENYLAFINKIDNTLWMAKVK